MKAFLMHRDKDFALDQALPPNAQDLTQDLWLDRLYGAMALGDPFLLDVARKAILASLTDPVEIVYRQHVLNDCLGEPAVVRAIYALAVEAIERERKVFGGFFLHPDAVLHRSIEVLELFVGLLKRLRGIADEHGAKFKSDGFVTLFEMVRRELDDDYFSSVEEHLERLRFRNGVLISARLGRGLKGADYTLRKSLQVKRSWWQWLSLGDRSPYTVEIADRDEAGLQALGELRGRGINLAANALARSCDHILSFFQMLRAELGFYVGCLNLHNQLAERGEPTCFPQALSSEAPRLDCRGLYDGSLSLSRDQSVVGNDVQADEKRLVMITGANQGGKSTFLRSVGQAYLMMQCGMFVCAERFQADVCDGLFTHYRREEDATMSSGKWDEELTRMSDLADQLRPHSVVLFNESFASTNEREGAEIAGGIIEALVEAQVKVFFVTHSYELAHGLEQMGCALFLRAERRADGERTFRVAEGESLPTSYGADLYRRIFEEAADSKREGGAGVEDSQQVSGSDGRVALWE